MTDWSVDIPRGAAPIRYANDRKETGTLINPEVGWELQMDADMTVDLVTYCSFDTTRLASPYSSSIQPKCSNAGSTITITEAGVYSIWASIIFSVVAGVGPYVATLAIYVNGSSTTGPNWQSWAAGTANSSVHVSRRLAVGDTVRVLPTQNGATVAGIQAYCWAYKVSN